MQFSAFLGLQLVVPYGSVPNSGRLLESKLAVFKRSSAKVVTFILLQLGTLMVVENGPSGFDISEKYQNSVFVVSVWAKLRMK